MRKRLVTNEQHHPSTAEDDAAEAAQTIAAAQARVAALEGARPWQPDP